MLIKIAFIFSLAALIGLYMLTRVFARQERKNLTLLLHGLFGGLGLSLLIYYEVMNQGKPSPTVSVFFFLFAALLGFLMVMLDKIGNKRIPKILPVIHGISALTGLILLIIFIFS